MKYIVLAVKDRAADVYGTPMFTVSIGTAIRSFGDEINRKDSHLSAHPEDYDLFHLGSYDDATGLFDCGSPRQVSVGKDLVRE